MNSALPPAYVNVPVPIAYAAVDDALIVTMTRILGLCWSYDYERTPAFVPDQLSDLIGRPRTTMYRHLSFLEKELGWLRIDRVGRRLILRPLIDVARESRGVDAPSSAEPAASPINQELCQALEDVGVEDPVRDQLARDGDLDPAWVHAWALWTRHPHRDNLTNPAGVIVRKLQGREPPPDGYLELATLTDRERSDLRASFWTGGAGLDDDLFRIRPLYLEIFGNSQVE